MRSSVFLFNVPQALQHDLDHVKALYRRGIALEELRRLQEALQSAQLVLKLDPGNKVGAGAECDFW